MTLKELLNEYGLDLRGDEIYVGSSNQKIGVLQWYEKRSNGDVCVFAWNTTHNEPVTLVLREDSKSVHIIAKQLSAKNRVTIYGELLDKLLREFPGSMLILTAEGEKFKGEFITGEQKIYTTPLQPSIAAVVWWLWGYIEDEKERKKHPRKGRRRRRY